MNKYTLPYLIIYESPRYKKKVIVPAEYESDGATGAFDIWSESWWVHDKLCDDGTWEDGTPVKNWQASSVLSDILRSEGRWFRAIYWKYFTFLFGCVKAKENGMW